MDSLSLQLDSLVPNDLTRLGGQLLDYMSSRLSGPRILQKRGELDGLADSGEEISVPEGELTPSVSASSPVSFEYPPFDPYSVVPSSPLSDSSLPLRSADDTSTVKGDVTSTGNEHLSNFSTYDEEADSASERAIIELFARADNSRYPRGSKEFYLEEMQRRNDETAGDTTLNDETRKRLQLNALSDTKAPFNIYNPYLSIDQLLAEFLATADVCDPQMTNIVKKGLHEVLLMEFGSESLVLESLRLLLAREDYLRCTLIPNTCPSVLHLKAPSISQASST
jgi:hypothetical protein